MCILIISRVNRLLQTGVLKERPLWLDVVEAFPPDVFPRHNQTPEGGRPLTIVFPDDDLRRYLSCMKICIYVLLFFTISRKVYENYMIVKQPEKCLSLFEDKPEVTSVCSRYGDVYISICLWIVCVVLYVCCVVFVCVLCCMCVVLYVCCVVCVLCCVVFEVCGGAEEESRSRR